MHTENSQSLALRSRLKTLKMVFGAKSSHIGSCFSCADLLAVLYAEVLRIDPKAPLAPGRDRFILSKGHAAAILYATLAERGFFPEGELNRFMQDGTPLTGHVSHYVPGIEFSSGSLGHGLPVGIGMALAAQRDQTGSRVFVLLSDGELDEGSNWEAFLFAPHHALDGLTVLIDYNKIQSFGRVSDVLALEPLVDKLRAFRWEVREIDGHDHGAIHAALSAPAKKGIPTAIVAHTVKGKGVGFMEDDLAWHYRPPTPEQFERARRELGEAI